MANGTINKTAWTDGALSTVIKVRKVHINELRSAVNYLESAVANVDNCGNCAHQCTVRTEYYYYCQRYPRYTNCDCDCGCD